MLLYSLIGKHFGAFPSNWTLDGGRLAARPCLHRLERYNLQHLWCLQCANTCCWFQYRLRGACPFAYRPWTVVALGVSPPWPRYPSDEKKMLSKSSTITRSCPRVLTYGRIISPPQPISGRAGKCMAFGSEGGPFRANTLCKKTGAAGLVWQFLRKMLAHVCCLLDQVKREKGVWWMPWQ